ncbi:hypothetical protein LOC71_16405 [Rhodopirellula sp. JC740]|uniref:Prenyltransferase n=1 Tax=Rhodopirellula halodulae TaxID=2894198 RepID=A0ABS8NKE3_9BACT|nr:hypothetical protein [Rhodopirellula sp. JC740]MCC9643869.1 hypothetical protein [Rhodopirellula sp. JC740]
MDPHDAHHIKQEEISHSHLPLSCWWNVLSLDAVTVAVLWQAVFLLSFCDRLPKRHESFSLGAVVWLIYVADRLLDGSRLDLSEPHLVRHRMHREFAGRWVIAWCLVLALACAVVVSWLDTAVVRMGLMVGASVMIYGAGVHFWPGGSPRKRVIEKELQVGAIFAAGVSLIAWKEAASWPLALATVASAGLFTANCWLVAERESTADQNFHGAGLKHRFRMVAVSVAVVVWALFSWMAGWLPWLMAASLLVGVGFLSLTKLLWSRGEPRTRQWSRRSLGDRGRRPLFDAWVPMADWSLILSPLVCWVVVSSWNLV